MKLYGWTFLIMLTAAAGVCGMGQKTPEGGLAAAYDQAYNPAREVTFEGRVIRVDPAPCATLPISNEHLHILLGQTPAEIDLGPCWYVQDQKPRIRTGDTISGVGSETVQEPGKTRLIVAREVHRGKEVLRLRDLAGKPLWRQKQ